jgi:putative serine protease PepD
MSIEKASTRSFTMKGTHIVLVIAAAAVVGAGVSAALVETTMSPGRDTVRTIIHENDGTASNASALKTTGKSVNQIYNEDSGSVVKIVSTLSGDGGAQGTGFEIDTQGHIVTNAHVVAGAKHIQVQTKDGKTYTAHLVGSDPTTDVAVVKIDASADSLHPLVFANSDTAKVGDGVVAIGDPFGLTDTVTSGIVSALGRTITSPNDHPINGAIQTDAAINHGNSGGPLLNSSGQVLGITSQIESGSESSGSVGVGFVVPSNTVKRIVAGLVANGHVSHPYLGVYVGTSTGPGAQVMSVKNNSPAAKAGIKVGDVITVFDGHKIQSPAQLVSRVVALKPGDQVTITVRRGGTEHQLKVTIGSQS